MTLTTRVRSAVARFRQRWKLWYSNAKTSTTLCSSEMTQHTEQRARSHCHLPQLLPSLPPKLYPGRAGGGGSDLQTCSLYMSSHVEVLEHLALSEHWCSGSRTCVTGTWPRPWAHLQRAAQDRTTRLWITRLRTMPSAVYLNHLCMSHWLLEMTAPGARGDWHTAPRCLYSQLLPRAHVQNSWELRTLAF